MNKICMFFLTLVFASASGQELKCNVKVNSDKLANLNLKVFKTLETSLNEFMNTTVWTTEVYKSNEKINCSITLVVDSFEADVFTGSLQVQSSRTAFNSTYSSPVFNFNDKNVSFKYLEFENLTYNPSSFDSNLISLVSFYANMIIALDQDTYANLGGTKTLEMAQNIVNNAQGNGKGWGQNDGNNTRYFLVNDLQSGTFSPYRETMYKYHLQGMDIMEKAPRIAKEKIIESIAGLKKMNESRPNSFLMRVFFDTKAEEIVSIFSGGPKVSITDLLENLNKYSPLNNEKWNLIKN